MSVSGTFTVLQGAVTTLGWMFREDIYAQVRPMACPDLRLSHGHMCLWVLGSIAMLFTKCWRCAEQACHCLLPEQPEDWRMHTDHMQTTEACRSIPVSVSELGAIGVM